MLTGRSKLNTARKFCCRGHSHRSTLEAQFCNLISDYQDRGKLEWLEVGYRFLILDSAKYEKPMKNERSVTYNADFVYQYRNRNGSKIVCIVDTKGVAANCDAIKRKILKTMLGKIARDMLVDKVVFLEIKAADLQGKSEDEIKSILFPR